MIQKFYILNLDTTLLEHIHAMTKTHTCLPAQRHNQRKERKNTVKKGHTDNSGHNIQRLVMTSHDMSEKCL